jgi:hypothetical protein
MTAPTTRSGLVKATEAGATFSPWQQLTAKPKKFDARRTAFHIIYIARPFGSLFVHHIPAPQIKNG